MVSANPKTENRATKLVINEKSRSLSFIKRKPTLKKKARELATLCDVSVSMICYGPDGELDTWPHNHEDLKDVILQYKAQRERGEPIQNFNLEGFLESKKKKFEAKKTRATKRLCSWDEKLNDFSNEKLMSLGAYLDSKIQSLKERRELLSMDNKEEAIQVCVGHDHDDPVDFSVKNGNSDMEPEFDQLLAQILEYNPTLFND